MTDPWWQPPPGRRGRVPLIRHPLRLTLVIGAGLVIVGSFLSWADGHLPGAVTVGFSPMTSPDGVILPIVAAAAIGLALSEGVAESRTRTLQVALAVLGVVAVLDWIIALGSADSQVQEWHRKNGTGEIGPGIWLGGVGVALLAVSGTILSIRAWRTNGAADLGEVVVTRRSAIRAGLEVAGGVGGFVGGMVFGLAVAGPAGIGLMTFGSLFGGVIGIAIGNRLGRLI